MIKYDIKFMKSKYDMVLLENCPYNISDYVQKNILKNKSKRNITKLINFIDRIIFQFIYTLASIQNKYPKFIHNDMFLRNILGIIETKYYDNDYIEYIYDNNHYYLEANGFYIKFNDFGLSILEPNIVPNIFKMMKKDPIFKYGDWQTYDDLKSNLFNFLHDLYDGQNWGAKSIMKILRDKKISSANIKQVRKIFNKYIDTKIIDRINKINKIELNRIWNIKNTKILRKTVQFSFEYFNKNIFKHFKKIPDDGYIVKTYHFDGKYV